MRNTMKILVLLVMIFPLLASSPGLTQAAPIYYLDANHPAAKDKGSHGAIDQPWQTLDYALLQLKAGDTLLVRAGTYRNNKILLQTGNSGSQDAPITVAAFPNETVIIDNGDIIQFDGASWWVFDGLIFQNFATTKIFLLGTQANKASHIIVRNSIFRTSQARPIFINYGEDVLLEKNQFLEINTFEAGQGANAIELLNYAVRITIRDNRFIDNATDGVHMGATNNPTIQEVLIENNEFRMTSDAFTWGENGVDIKTVQGPVVVRGNIFSGYRPTVPDGIGQAGGSRGTGIVLHNGSQNVLIERNIFADNTVHLTVADQQKEGFPPTANVTVVNNIFKLAKYYPGNQDRPAGPGVALSVNKATQNIQILHNTFVDNDIYLASSGMVADFRNNVIQGGSSQITEDSTWNANNNAWANLNGKVPKSLRGPDDLHLENLKLDNELRPLPNSPLLNRGHDIGISEDFDGKPRLDGQPDLGAFEYGGIVVTPAVQVINPGETALYTIQFITSPGSADTISVNLTNPSADLILNTTSLTVGANQTVNLTISDTHPAGSPLMPGVWHTIPLAVTSPGLNQSMAINLLVGGSRTYVPLAVK